MARVIIEANTGKTVKVVAHDEDGDPDGEVLATVEAGQVKGFDVDAVRSLTISEGEE